MTFSHSSSSASTGVDSTSPHCASRAETSAFSDASGISVMACPSKKASWDTFSNRIHLLHRGVCATDGKGGAKAWEEKSTCLGPCNFAQRLARFEDSVLGMAIGALVPFALMIGMLHLGGGQ